MLNHFHKPRRNMFVTDLDRHSTRANSRWATHPKPELIHTSYRSESSTISLVVVDKEEKQPTGCQLIWIGCQGGLPGEVNIWVGIWKLGFSLVQSEHNCSGWKETHSASELALSLSAARAKRMPTCPLITPRVICRGNKEPPLSTSNIPVGAGQTKLGPILHVRYFITWFV